MEKKDLKQLVDKGLSLSGISNVTGKSKTAVRYWLKKYSMKTNHKLNDSKYCLHCGKESKSKTCNYCNIKIRRYRQKIAATNYKGGKCEICGYSDDIGTFQFHHINPIEKDFKISDSLYSWEKLKKELDKCVMLCANCHSKEHAKHEESYYKLAKSYTGNNKDFAKYIYSPVA